MRTMKGVTALKTKSYQQQQQQPNTGRDSYSADCLRRLFKSLSSWTRWSSLRSSQATLVETLRLIAEVVIWGDQNDAGVFAVFREEEGLERLIRILRKKSNRRGPVAIQMLQTFAMLVQNLRDKCSLAYLLNHDATRQIISMDFDFEDEEVLGYYVSFVKSISLNLNESTVMSFTRRTTTQKSDVLSMPLFSEAAKFVNSRERMVRSAARTLTLRIMSSKNDRVDKFLVSPDNRGFFKDQVDSLRSKIGELDRLKRIEKSDKHTLIRITAVVDEVEDAICYLNDIYACGSKAVQMELANTVWDDILGQYLIFPLFEVMNNQLKGRSAQPMSEEGFPLLQLPKVETLMSITSEWIPLKESDFHRTIFATFIASTMNVLLRRSDFMYSRVVMQLINQAFQQLEKSAQERLVPLVNVDLETLDLNEDPEWRIEATKMDTKMKVSVGPTMGLLEFADNLGLHVVLDVLKVLFHQTKCDKYRPSPLLAALAKNPKMMFKGRRFIPFSHSVRNSIKVGSPKKSIHRRLSSLTHVSSSLKGRGRTGSF